MIVAGIILSVWQIIIILYLLLINLTSFFMFGLDKVRAVNRSRRISEKKLWLSVLLGGSLGALLGMNFFRHKTKKLSFQTVLAIILLGQIWLVYYLLN